MADPTNSSTESSLELNAEAKQAINSLNARAAQALQEPASNFAKLKITPYEVKDGFRKYFEPKTVIINPESYSRKMSAGSRRSRSRKGANGSENEKKIIEFRESVSFELWFDNTGAIPDSEDVATTIKWFEDNLIKYDGEVHSTRYVKLFWGSAFSFFGQLGSFDIQYLYFSRTGEPLRAKANLSFDNILEARAKAQTQKPQSPDLTHLRTVQAGDNLPLMCYRIYNNPHFYLKVAEANGLANFTDIQPGQKIYFPPLKP